MTVEVLHVPENIHGRREPRRRRYESLTDHAGAVYRVYAV